jgi:NAD(P)-dependent dehydrogenase (short-subunit alcohol dehydrogenase family)
MATPDDLAATVKLVEDIGTRIVAQQADVRDRGALKTALKAGVEELGGRLDIVIANAGIAPMASADAWQDVIDVNLTGIYHTIDVGMRPMIKAGNGGSIVLTSSVAGLVGLAAPQPGSIGYAAAKHGMVGLMRVYANLLGSLDIRVNSIHPAAVRTPMVENEFTRAWLADMASNAGGNSSVSMDTIEPEDIANTVAWLVSDAGRHISGVALPVDAGYVNRR